MSKHRKSGAERRKQERQAERDRKRIAEKQAWLARLDGMFGPGWDDDVDDVPIFPPQPVSNEDSAEEPDYDQRAKDENRAQRFGDLDR